MINGESYPKLLMTIIRFVVTSNDHRTKKLLTIYWETVDKCKENGELKEEMILVCNALRNDLMHPNEYIRGSTLRLLCKMKYYRILEPLKEAILRNLSHRHSYVRRNAVMCVYSIVKSFGIEVMPEATEDVEQLLLVEGDISTKRNAFMMLSNCDTDRAIKYVLSVQDQVPTMGDIFQLAVLELVRKACRTSPQHKGRFLRIVFNLATSTSTAVAFDCASTLFSLTSSPVAIHQATHSYVQLLTEQSDNNVKLIVLARLREVQKKHRHVMEGLVMDILRALTCPSLDVRKKVMDICLGPLITPRNIKDVVTLLKKEVVKTMGYDAQGTEGNTEYRRLLIRALHSCTGQYPEHAQSVMFLFMDFLTESDQTTATEVVMFLRETLAGSAELRVPVFQRLAEILGDIHQSRVLRGCLWLFGEFCDEDDLILDVVEAFLAALRPLPLVFEEAATANKEKKGGADAGGQQKAADKEARQQAGKVTTKTVVLADGTYGTETVYENKDEGAEDKDGDAAGGKAEAKKKTSLRTLLLGGDFLLSSMLGVSLTKLCLKRSSGVPTETRNEALFVLANLFKLVKQHSCGGEHSYSAVRLAQCLRSLLAAGGGCKKLSDSQLAAVKLTTLEWTSGSSRSQLGKVLEIATLNSEWALGADQDEPEERMVPPDECIQFRQLRERKGGPIGSYDTLDDDDDFNTARGYSLAGNAAADGALFVQRPVSVTLSPGQQLTSHASIKVASTETGMIFGYVTYDKAGAADKECTVLNELHVDILDYIGRAWIGDLAFRTMWSEFEWENKININTSITEVGTYFEHIMRNTNMSVVGRSSKKAAAPTAAARGGAGQRKEKLTAEQAQEMLQDAVGVQGLIDSSSFVAVNLYAKSIFGEDALANISIEKLGDGKLTGSVRIRSRTQGIALSLGDRITVVQRGIVGAQR